MTTIASPVSRLADMAARRRSESTFSLRLWWARHQVAIWTVIAFASLDYAAFSWHRIVGFVAVGLSCLIMSWLVEHPAAPAGGDRR